MSGETKNTDRRQRITHADKEGLLKVPPQSIDLEKSVLGAVLTESKSIYKVLSIIKDDTFYTPSHQKIWEACINLFRSERPIDTITVLEELKSKKQLTAQGITPQYINSLVDNILGSSNIENHARLLEEKAIARRTIGSMMHTINKLYDQNEDVFDILAISDEDLFQARTTLLSTKDVTPQSVGQKLKDHIARGLHMGGITGVRTGIDALDELTGGWQKQSLITIAARPRIGKSAILAAFMDTALKDGDPQMIFSMEMRDIEFFVRLVSLNLRREGIYIPYSQIMTARLDNEQYEKVGDMIKTVTQLPIYIDDTPNLTALDVKSRLMRYTLDYGIKTVAADYLQLMQHLQNKGSNDANALSQTMTDLKNTAKYLDMPLIALSQVDRNVDKRAGGGSKIPTIADMKGSGGIEEKSDIILILDRPDAYESDPVDELGASMKGMTRVVIAKNKMGPTGEIIVPFDVATNYIGDGYREEMHLPPVNEKVNTLLSQGMQQGDFFVTTEMPPKNFVIRPSRMNDIEDEPPF